MSVQNPSGARSDVYKGCSFTRGIFMLEMKPVCDIATSNPYKWKKTSIISHGNNIYRNKFNNSHCTSMMPHEVEDSTHKFKDSARKFHNSMQNVHDSEPKCSSTPVFKSDLTSMDNAVQHDSNTPAWTKSRRNSSTADKPITGGAVPSKSRNRLVDLVFLTIWRSPLIAEHTIGTRYERVTDSAK